MFHDDKSDEYYDGKDDNSDKHYDSNDDKSDVMMAPMINLLNVMM